MKQIAFTKAQALGNDFVIIASSALEEIECSPHFTRWIQQFSHRKYGIGFDQLIIYKEDVSSALTYHIRFFNADGSEAESCGNGSRAVAKFLFQNVLESHIELSCLKLITKGGEVRVKRSLREGREYFESEFPLPVLSSLELQKLSVIPFAISKCFQVNAGNPHLVLVCTEEVADLTEYAATYGDLLHQDPLFPSKINVGFLRILSEKPSVNRHIESAVPIIELVVFERGVGVTLACGTGALAAARVYMHLHQHWQNQTNRAAIIVKQQGGSLYMDSSLNHNTILQKGEAEIVFSGFIPNSDHAPIKMI